MSTHRTAGDDEQKEPKNGSVGEPSANPTPPDQDPATTPGVEDTPQTPPDHRH